MNAIQFIQQHGVEKTRKVVEGAPFSATVIRTTQAGNHLYYKLENGEYWVYFKLSDEWWLSEIQDGNQYASLSDLKRLVESVDLVDLLGGIEALKRKIDGKHIGYTHFNINRNGRWSFLDHYIDFIPDSAHHIGMVNKAIADYELIYSDKEMGDDSHGDYMQMTLEQLQQEHAELLLFNDELDRNCKAHKAKANKYQTKCWHIQTLLINPVDKDMTLKAIKTVIERVGEF